MIKKASTILIPLAVGFALLSPIQFTYRQQHERILSTVVQTTEVSSEPSHIQLCRAITNPTPKTVTIHEDPHFCRDQNTPYTSLIQVFVSTLLAEVSRKNDLKISYEHNCQNGDGSSSRRLQDEMTVQESLEWDAPTPSSSAEDADPDSDWAIDGAERMDLHSVTNLCGYCIDSYEARNASSPECLLFSSSSHDTDVLDVTSRKMLDEVVGMEVILPSIRRHLTKVSSRFEDVSAEFRSRDAVIYLSCETEDGDLCRRDELENFEEIIAREIPSYVKKITILASPMYYATGSEKIENLVSWVQRFYPRAVEVTSSVPKSTASLYSMMMKARYLVCSTGMSCVLPALSTVNYASVVKSPELYPWVSKVPLGNNVNFVDPEFNPSHCLYMRGRSGRWVKDLKLAKKYQYATPLQHLFGEVHRNYKPTRRNPVLPSTQYKWQDTSFPQCNVEPLDRKKFCNVMEKLGVTRIFFVGDSLTKQQAESLWKLLGMKSDPGHYKWTQEVQCRGSSRASFKITYVRNNHLTEVNLGTDSENQPWAGEYATYQGKSIMVANTGPHIHDFGQFKKQSFQVFVDVVTKINKPDDIFFFRTSVPGHPKCERYDAPFKSYAEYLKNNENMSDKERSFSWENFVHYNEWVDQHFTERKRNKRGPNIQILDVYPMGVLRPDGHRTAHEDCLHYNMPGPIDWWNHLMYSQLATMADELEER